MIRIRAFETRYKGDKPEDWVHVSPVGEAGERTSTWHRIESIRPRPVPAGDTPGLSQIDMQEKWKQIGPAYDAWKAGNAIPEHGTALAAWAGLDAPKVEALRRNGILTVEEAAQMTDATIKLLPFPDARKIPSLAKKWLDGRGEAKMAEEIEAQKEQMEVMAQMIADLQKDKPKRGRPPKIEKEAAA